MVLAGSSRKHGARRAPRNSVSNLCAIFQTRILSGELKPGQYLPPVRALCAHYGAALETVCRALTALRQQGVLERELRRGYRVVSSAAGALHAPVALLVDSRQAQKILGHHRAVQAALQAQCLQSDQPVISLSTGHRPPQLIVEQLRALRVSAVLLVTADPALVQALLDAGFPTVLVDSCIEGVAVDAVLQDNFLGGYLAARHLAAAGCRRIAWIGSTLESVHGRERLGGACAGLYSMGLSLDSNLIFLGDTHDTWQAFRQCLSGAARPDGIMVLWLGAIDKAHELCQALNLDAGSFQWVGWAEESCYANECRTWLNQDFRPAAITWSAQDMAAAALQRLRPPNASSHAVRACTKIPVKLHLRPQPSV